MAKAITSSRSLGMSSALLVVLRRSMLHLTCSARQSVQLFSLVGDLLSQALLKQLPSSQISLASQQQSRTFTTMPSQRATLALWDLLDSLASQQQSRTFT